jgi:hypothetical protein
MVEHERLRRLREKRQGLKSVYRLKSDGKTGIADQSRTGSCHNAAKKQEMAETGSRLRRDSDWFFESLKGLLADDGGDPLALIVNPQPLKGAHYASFPEKLVEPLIKAGCPKEICVKCRKARERIVEYKGGTIGKSWHDHSADKEKGMMQSSPALNLQENENGEKYQRIDKGYTDCGCNAGFRPGIVLDPFFGSGTVGVVAERLNRRWVGLDLGYQDLQRERLVGIQKEMPIMG